MDEPKIPSTRPEPPEPSITGNRIRDMKGPESPGPIRLPQPVDAVAYAAALAGLALRRLQDSRTTKEGVNQMLVEVDEDDLRELLIYALTAGKISVNRSREILRLPACHP